MKEDVIILVMVDEKLSSYLEDNLELFVESWKKRIIYSEHDVYKDNISENGRRMLQLVVQCLKDDKDLGLIKEHAFKVAAERVEAKVNIGEFIYNVNNGRSEIFKHLYDSGIQLVNLQPTINRINVLFDEFIYYAVLRYTEIKDKELEDSKTYIEQAHHDRLTLLGQMSSSFVHEIRNPLTSVIGFTKILRNEYSHLPYLDIISYELEQLNFRITQFLLLSKKEVVDSTREKFYLGVLLKDIKGFLYPSFAENNVSFTLELDDGIFIDGFKQEIRQVLLNILLNSIDALQNEKKEKRIHVRAQVVEGKTIISISNNGPMIPKNTITEIFKPFVTHKKTGTGIGLYVCRQIIEKHHGDIYCESNPDWTTFFIEL